MSVRGKEREVVSRVVVGGGQGGASSGLGGGARPMAKPGLLQNEAII